MNEAQTRRDLIDKLIEAAGWTEANGCKILVEQSAPGKVGKIRGKPLAADYVLTYRGRRLVVVEAKRDEDDAALGFAQALKYGRLLGMTASYATNGKEIYEMDLTTGGADPVPCFPSPQEIWKRAFPNECGWRDTFTAEPFWFNAVKKVRYYQELAINRVLDAVAENRKRILLTLATGTGKTFIAFQIAWKLFKTKWNLESAQTDGEGLGTRHSARLSPRPEALALETSFSAATTRRANSIAPSRAFFAKSAMNSSTGAGYRSIRFGRRAVRWRTAKLSIRRAV